MFLFDLMLTLQRFYLIVTMFEAIYRILSLVTLFFCGILPVWSGKADSISSRIRHQLQLFPQEKVFVHTDRYRYMAGDTIWLRAHLVDAVTHIPASVSRYVYVELADEADSIVNRIKLREDNEIYRGQLVLDSLLGQGYYTLRAYTDFMRNLPEDYLFKRTIPVSGTYLNQSAKETLKQKTGNTELDVAFFPEGGDLPVGVLWKVAFKAVGKDGWHEQISGRIVEKESEEVVAELPVPYLGMGYVSFCPQVGKEYVAQCLDEQNRYHEFPLPKPVEKAQVLSVHRRKEMLMVALNKPVAAPRYLVMHIRGMVFYAGLWTEQESPVCLEPAQLPPGVIQILLLDEQFRPLSERLVFNKGTGIPDVSLQLDEKKNQEGSVVQAEVQVMDCDGHFLQGNFSVSVTDDAEVETDGAPSIYTYLLLTSDLRGEIEFPEAYFDSLRPGREANLDVLMMTQGWKRYDWSEALQGRYAEPKIGVERSQEITGRLLREFNHKPRAGHPVALFSPNCLFTINTITDSLGRFRFAGFDFPDTTRYVVSGTTRKGYASGVLLQLDEKEFYRFAPSRDRAALYAKGNVMNDYGVDTLDNRGLLTFRLDEVVVKASRIPKRQSSWYNFPLSNTYTYDYFTRFHPHSMLDLLSQLPGVSRAGSQLLIQGKAPAYILDDTETPSDVVFDMSPDDVYQVTIVKDASAVVLGAGVERAILIMTKTGEIHKTFDKNNILPCKLLGYHQPVEFYSPKFVPVRSEEVATYLEKRPTIYWNPNVTLDKNGKAFFDFCMFGKKNACTILLQGVALDGQLVFLKKKIDGFAE